MANRFSVEAIFKATDRITAPVTRMQNAVGSLTRKFGSGLDKVNRVTDKVSNGLKHAGVVAGIGLGIATAAMSDVVRTGMDFEQSIVNAAAHFENGFKNGSKEFYEISDAARQIGRTTEFSATQAGVAMDDLAKAGFSVKAAIGSLPTIVNMATAANIDLSQASLVAMDALGSFNMWAKDRSPAEAARQVKNLERVANVLAFTANATTTNVADLYETLKDGAPVARTTVETFNALAGKLGSAGIKGSNAGTTLKNMYLSLQAPTPQAIKVLNRLRVSPSIKGNMRDMIDILDDLGTALKGYGTSEKGGMLETIFGRIPIAGVNALLDVGADKLREFRKQLENVEGTNKRTADFMRMSLLVQMRMFNNSIDSVKLSIFTIINGPLRDLIKQFTEYTRANEKLIATKIGNFFNGLVKNFSTIVYWIKVIGISLAIFFALTTALKTLALVLTVVNLVMSANPVVLITLAVIALIAGIVMLFAWFHKLGLLMDIVKGALLGLVIGVGIAMGPIGWLILAAGLIIKYWKPISAFFSNLGTIIVNAFKSAIEWVGKMWTAAMPFINSISKLLGFGDLNTSIANPGTENNVEPQVVSPQERTWNMFSESKTTNSSEVTIMDQTGRAQVTKGTLGTGLNLVHTGAF